MYIYNTKQFYQAMCLIAAVLIFCFAVLLTESQDPAQNVPRKEYPPYHIVPGHHFVKK